MGLVEGLCSPPCACRRWDWGGVVHTACRAPAQAPNTSAGTANANAGVPPSACHASVCLPACPPSTNLRKLHCVTGYVAGVPLRAPHRPPTGTRLPRPECGKNTQELVSGGSHGGGRRLMRRGIEWEHRLRGRWGGGGGGQGPRAAAVFSGHRSWTATHRHQHRHHNCRSLHVATTHTPLSSTTTCHANGPERGGWQAALPSPRDPATQPPRTISPRRPASELRPSATSQQVQQDDDTNEHQTHDQHNDGGPGRVTESHKTTTTTSTQPVLLTQAWPGSRIAAVPAPPHPPTPPPTPTDPPPMFHTRVHPPKPKSCSTGQNHAYNHGRQRQTPQQGISKWPQRVTHSFMPDDSSV
jgi:hypothetical protein